MTKPRPKNSYPLRAWIAVIRGRPELMTIRETRLKAIMMGKLWGGRHYENKVERVKVTK